MSRLLTAFIKHEAGIRHLLSRYMSRNQDIEDLLQETFLKAFAAEGRWTIRAPKSYLFRIAKNLALNELVKKSNTTTDYIEDFPTPDVLYDSEQTSVTNEVEVQQQLTILVKAISSHPTQCRRVVVMRKVEGLSFKEVAERLDISVSTAEKHAAKGLLKCAQVMQNKGFDSPYLNQRMKLKALRNSQKNTVVELHKSDKQDANGK